MNYEVVIGLEIHCELRTKTKIFCGCANGFGVLPNENCCPICLAMPGTLPVVNKQAVEYAVAAGIALNCKINKISRFDRKSYFYPDLPKAYQITQFYKPICGEGLVEFKTDGGQKKVRINRIHLEEDAGKLVHSNFGGTLVDYNRGGVPLIEIVTEPDIKGPADAVAFLEQLRRTLKYSGVSDCKMEEGALRCDVNLSLNKKGDPLGTRTEMKNLNSFKSAYNSMLYEMKRQAEILDGGGSVKQETRRWDDGKGKSFVMRSKEDAIDYRYVLDPDLTPIVLSDKFIDDIRAALPEMPASRRDRYINDYKLPVYDAEILTADKEISDFFDRAVALYDNPKMISNRIMGDILRKLKGAAVVSAVGAESVAGVTGASGAASTAASAVAGAAASATGAGGDITIPFTAEDFTDLLRLVGGNVISQSASKQVFEIMWDEGGRPLDIVKRHNLVMDSNAGEIEAMARELIKNNPQAAADFKGGNSKALAFFVGQIMKATKGKANPTVVNEILNRELNQGLK